MSSQVANKRRVHQLLPERVLVWYSVNFYSASNLERPLCFVVNNYVFLLQECNYHCYKAEIWFEC